MYRDGTALIACCLVGLSAYGASLGLVLPETTVRFEPDEPAVVGMVSEEINGDPDLPWNYNVERIEEVSVPGPISDPPPGSECPVN